jgi:NADH-quinone oxidoreductase subunit G
LTSKDFRFSQRIWFLTSTPSVCHGCAKGCSIFIDHNREKYKDDTIYRFKPRENPAVNGYFICDEGRLSYKELQKDRQTEILLKGAVCSKSEALKAYGEALESVNGEIIILADPNLYREELVAIEAYAAQIGASLYAPLEHYQDEAFADNWLKSSQRAANAKAVEVLGIKTTLPVRKAALLINFNHLDADQIKAEKVISFQTHIGKEEYDLLLPLAVFSESAGTMINEEGVEQYCPKVIERNEPLPTVIEWLTLIEGGER